MAVITVCGLDPSLNNWGIAKGKLDLISKQLYIKHVEVIKPITSTNKQTRTNSNDLSIAQQHYEKLRAVLSDVQLIYVELPVGSQSARSMVSYGLCIGVMGAIKCMNIPVIEVTATEVKLAGFGTKTATKKEMIQWALSKHPEAKWPTYNELGKVVLSESKAEHMADAIAAIYAGIKINSVLSFVPSTTN